MKRWFSSAHDMIWRWDSDTGIAIWYNSDGTYNSGSELTLDDFDPNDELDVPPWQDLILQEGL